MAIAAIEVIDADTAIEHIVTSFSIQCVIPLVAHDRIVATTSVNDIMANQSADTVVQRVAIVDIVSRCRLQHLYVQVLRRDVPDLTRSAEHTSALQSLMSISSAFFCYKKNT